LSRELSVPENAPLPPWPADPPSAGSVLLRRFTEADAPMARDLATDPYVPLIGTLPADATDAQAREWIRRQLGRWAEGRGFSFAVAEVATGRAVGGAGLWLTGLSEGRASAGYAIAPRDRGRGYAVDALTALTRFAWTLPGLCRVELYIEPWNVASVRVAERSGYAREGLLRSFQEIGGRRRDLLLYAAVREGD
jgi:RimJ/RimL family protein N-acetyltransferase